MKHDEQTEQVTRHGERAASPSALTRRTVLRAGVLAGGGLAAAALIGCGDDDSDEPAGQPSGQTSTPGATGTAEPDYVTQARADGAPYPYGYPEPSTAPKQGGVFRQAVSWSIASTWDVNKEDSHAKNVANAVANRLVGLVTGPELNKFQVELEPELASSWEVSPDGLTYTFTLQDGVNYHNVPPVDGRPLVAEDVKLAYERAAGEGSTNRLFFQLMDQVTAPDEKTVRITMTRPDADFLIPLASRSLPIYPPELFEGDLLSTGDTKAIGTGPFILDEVDRDQFIRVRANPDYWEGAPHLDGMEWRVMPDPSARTAAFRAGQIDFGADVPDQVKLEALVNSMPDLLVMNDPALVPSVMYGMNSQNPKFQDERVRQALHLSVDRDKMVQLLYQGAAKVLPAMGWPLLFDREPTGDELGRWWGYDPEEASRMIAAAGADGMSFEHVDSVAYGERSSLNGLMVDFYRAIGVNMSVKLVDYNAFNNLYYARKFKDEAEAMLVFSTTAPSANGYFYDNLSTKSAASHFAINDAEIDQWAEEQRNEVDPEARKEILRKIWDKMLDQAYLVELPVPFTNVVFPSYVRYARFNGAYISLHTWYDLGMGSHQYWLDK